MTNEKIDKHSLKTLKPLVGRLMAYEARQILIDSGKHNPRARNFAVRYAVPPEEIKKRIIEIFRNNSYEIPDTELLKDMSLEYLDEMMGFATANPSYSKLKKRILTGKYDFLSALEINACS